MNKIVELFLTSISLQISRYFASEEFKRKVKDFLSTVVEFAVDHVMRSKENQNLGSE